MPNRIPNSVSLLLAGCLLAGGLAAQQRSPKPASATVQLASARPAFVTALEKSRVTLPNNWSLTPAGHSLPLGDLPLNMVVSPNGKRLAVTNNGQSRQSVQLFDLTTETLLSEITIPKSWLGLRFSPDGSKVYAAGGNDNRVVVYSTTGDKLKQDTTIVLGKGLPNRIWPTGLEVDKAGQTLYVVTKDDSTMYVCDLTTYAVKSRVKLPAEAYTCLRSPVSDELFVSIWGGDKVLIYNQKTGQITGEITGMHHPSDLLLTRDGKYLFTANANDNSVSVIDVKTRRVLETLNTALFPDAPAGSTPNALALSPDQKTLLVANADNNCLAMFDVTTKGRSRSLGFVPTGWYPTAVQVVGGKVLVANGKGMTSLANPQGPSPYKRRDDGTQYIGGLFKGTLSIFDLPKPTEMAGYSQLVYQNTPYTKARETESVGEAGNPIPMRVGAKGTPPPSPIKYVFYIIKENRTYDQVFGDMPGGNGDTSLCLFPEKITPNQHALAREYVLLDNFYVDAEVSADGHNWSTAAYANDYVEKIWQTSYGGRGGTYDFEGSRPVAFPKGGFIWDYCKRAGLSYRSYGEFQAYSYRKDKALAGHFCPKYPDYDLGVKDITRFEVLKRDLDSLIAIKAVSRFNSIRFGNNHTSGARMGARTPAAFVADNDLAVGQFVDYLSHSPIWAESAVFILEDDAQNGADHVDAHRSPALVISPYTKRKYVDHTMYSTSGMLRTIELILGLPPMSQYDAAATPMFASFTPTPDLAPFTHREAGVDLDAKNTVWNEPARRSEKFDLRYADMVNDDAFNEVIWMAVKGEHVPMPAPRRSAFVRLVPAKDKDED
jgi:YVTN family beta-propeller protein